MLRKAGPCGAFAAALLVACGDSAAPAWSQPTPRAPSLSISDAASGGRPGFYFLAPQVLAPTSFPGAFDPGVAATARICAAADSCAAPLASFTVGGAPGAAIAVDTVRQSYGASWAAPADLPLGAGNYRLEVLAAGLLLGYADLFVAANPTDLRNTPQGYAGMVRGATNAIRFRIERGAFPVPALPPDTIPRRLYADSNVMQSPSQMTGRMLRRVVEVMFAAGTSQADRQAAVDQIGGVVVGGVRVFADGDGVYLVHVPSASAPDSLFAAIARLRQRPSVAFVGPHVLGGDGPAFRRPRDGDGWTSWQAPRRGVSART